MTLDKDKFPKCMTCEKECKCAEEREECICSSIAQAIRVLNGKSIIETKGTNKMEDLISKQAVLDLLKNERIINITRGDGVVTETHMAEIDVDELINLPSINSRNDSKRTFMKFGVKEHFEKPMCEKCLFKTDTCQDGLHCPMDR